MTFIPQKNKKAERLAFLFLITALLFMALASVLDYSVIFQIIAAVIAVVGIQILSRYVLSDYRYIVNDRDDGVCELIVYKKQGRREEMVCRLSLSSVTELSERTDKKRRANKSYNYTQNLSARAYSLIFSEGDGTVEVVIESCPELIKILRERIGVGEDDFNFAM